MMTPETFETMPFVTVRNDFREMLIGPVMSWMLCPRVHRTDARFRDLLLVPLDLAVAGSVVTVQQTERRWCVELQGAALFHAAALFRLADQGEAMLDLLQRGLREAQTQILNTTLTSEAA